jgi:RHS repeat-associated protein
MGRQIFKSNEYLNRNRADRDYVYDLYQAYLQRGPDQAGWDHWTNAVATDGRDNVRMGFEYSLEFSNLVATFCPRGSGAGSPVPRDGLSSLSFDAASNRTTTAGFQYDAAGNQTRIVRVDGSAQKFQYDAAGRVVKVKDGFDYTLATYTYGPGKQRLIAQDGADNSNFRTYYVWAGESVIAEYRESDGSPTVPQWSQLSIFAGGRLISTITPNGTGEFVQYHHPDRLGTRLITNASNTSVQEQVHLPFGTALDGESTGASEQRFTSYDRSAMTGLDYAVNRTYDSQQGRFTQVDPAGMGAVSLGDPQSLNMYAYCANDPVNRTDPSGLFWGKLFGFIKKLFKIIAVAVAVALAIIAIWIAPPFGAAVVAKLLVMSGLILASTFGPRPVKVIIGLGLLAFGIYTGGVGSLFNFSGLASGGIEGTKNLLTTLAPWLGAISAVTNFMAEPQKKQKQVPKEISTPVAIVRAILSGVNACSAYFGQNAIDALNALEQQLTRGYPNGMNDTKLGIRMSGPQTDHIKAGSSAPVYRTYDKAVINGNGPFYNRFSKTRFGNYDPGKAQSQSLQILHELGHMVYKNGKPLLADDGGSGLEGVSEDNTKEILKHCKAEIDKIK